ASGHPAADGSFSFAVPPAAVTTVIASSLDGYDPPSPPPSGPVAPGASLVLTVTYSAWGSFVGTVLDNLGAPVAGALISGSGGQTTLTDNQGKYTLYAPRGPTTLSAGPVPGL